METCENIKCESGYLECENCNGTSIDLNENKCDECFDGLVECVCNPNNIRNKHLTPNK